jgi:hypothetical protein
VLSRGGMSFLGSDGINQGASTLVEKKAPAVPGKLKSASCEV